MRELPQRCEVEERAELCATGHDADDASCTLLQRSSSSAATRQGAISERDTEQGVHDGGSKQRRRGVRGHESTQRERRVGARRSPEHEAGRVAHLITDTRRDATTRLKAERL